MPAQLCLRGLSDVGFAVQEAFLEKVFGGLVYAYQMLHDAYSAEGAEEFFVHPEVVRQQIELGAHREEVNAGAVNLIFIREGLKGGKDACFISRHGIFA